MSLVESYLSDEYGLKFWSINSAKEPPKDADYIYGAILWTIDDQPFLTKEEWDLVDQLWGYLVNAMLEITQGRDADFYFPDMPLPVNLSLLHGWDGVKLKVGDGPKSRTIVTQRRDFIRAGAEGAKHFFEKMGMLVPSHPAPRDQLSKIEKLESWLAK